MRITLCGPIEHWWDENWDTPEHWDYVAWRGAVSQALVTAGHLVYRPHEAFKGEWDGNDGDTFAQLVNNAALLASEVVLDLTPPGIPSDGTKDELGFCERENIYVIHAPPPYKLGIGERQREGRERFQGHLTSLVNSLKVTA